MARLDHAVAIHIPFDAGEVRSTAIDCCSRGPTPADEVRRRGFHCHEMKIYSILGSVWRNEPNLAVRHCSAGAAGYALPPSPKASADKSG
jgi:hypothetical protein